ncbi:GlcNAc-transferase family protein [Jonesiaceae bacterium BS-20]|uniref:GlcNAc-transferase family protein n=1 Tax=Jonesiaceae bacterium BS-20 TaxID=3120821 RepID=A0AAU7DWU1_9MICO
MLRTTPVDWNRGQGLGWAKRLTDNLYRDETLALQIDSHSVFETNWDTNLIAQRNEKDDPRAVLSSYPPAFSFDTHGEVQFATYLPNEVAIKEFVEPGVPKFYGRPTGNFTSPVPFVAGGMQFGPGSTPTNAFGMAKKLDDSATLEVGAEIAAVNGKEIDWGVEPIIRKGDTLTYHVLMTRGQAAANFTTEADLTDVLDDTTPLNLEVIRPSSVKSKEHP